MRYLLESEGRDILWSVFVVFDKMFNGNRSGNRRSG
jgi:hypothetical protein